MEDKRQENQAPLNQRQQLSGTVDDVDRSLERFRPIQQASVGGQVHAHVEAKRHDPGQGVESPDGELMLGQER